ncbi:MAG TPA: helix-turn-helix domain-containing protein [Rhodoblastus sp.]|nr:helix-turn-helix domain-containing protein [Rhodoblastus sp.]
MAEISAGQDRSSQRDKIVRATAQLLRQRGYAATGLSDIIETSGAPKGSLYHYFPGGKDNIALEALRYAGDKVQATLAELAGQEESAAAVLRRYGALVAGWMAESNFRDGCPIATTLLETAAEKSRTAEAGRSAFAGWTGVLREKLLQEGVARARAERLARLAVMALEGALVFARVEGDAAPIIAAMEEVADLMEREAAR